MIARTGLLLTGRVQSGEGDASRWLMLFNDAYASKTGMRLFPGSLNVARDVPFDWFVPRATYGLEDGDVVEIEVPDLAVGRVVG